MVPGFDDLNVDFGNLAQADRQVGVEVVLLERAILDSESLAQHLTCSPQRRTLDLGHGIDGVDGDSHVHGNRQFLQVNFATLGVDRDLGDPGHPGRALPFLCRRYRDAHAVVLRHALSVSRLAGSDPKDVGQPLGAADRCRLVGDPAVLAWPRQRNPKAVHVVVGTGAGFVAGVRDSTAGAFAGQHREP